MIKNWSMQKPLMCIHGRSCASKFTQIHSRPCNIFQVYNWIQGFVLRLSQKRKIDERSVKRIEIGKIVFIYGRRYNAPYIFRRVDFCDLIIFWDEDRPDTQTD